MGGTSYERPHSGKVSHENFLANPGAGCYIMVAGTDDSGDGQIYIYVGEKTNSDNPVEAVGLIVVFLLNPLLTGVSFAFSDVVVVSMMGLICFVPFILFLRGTLSAGRSA
jgi:hypothetical protein